MDTTNITFPSFFKEPTVERYTAVIAPKEAVQVTLFGFLNAIEHHNLFGVTSDLNSLISISEAEFMEAYGKCEYLLRKSFTNSEQSHEHDTVATRTLVA